MHPGQGNCVHPPRQQRPGAEQEHSEGSQEGEEEEGGALGRLTGAESLTLLALLLALLLLMHAALLILLLSVRGRASKDPPEALDQVMTRAGGRRAVSRCGCSPFPQSD